MSKETFKRVYMLGLLVWIAWIITAVVLGRQGTISGNVILIVSAIYALLYGGGYGVLRMTGRL